EKNYTKKQTIQILKRLVNSLEKGKTFRMQIKNKKVYIPKESEIEIEYEKEKKDLSAGRHGEKIEIEIKWKK
ncbi:MAG: amphi-Trp domain-containing protein, partial [bacterium]